MKAIDRVLTEDRRIEDLQGMGPYYKLWGRVEHCLSLGAGIWGDG